MTTSLIRDVDQLEDLLSEPSAGEIVAHRIVPVG